MSHRMHYFNQAGIDEFERQLDEMETHKAPHSITALLTDSAYTVRIEKAEPVQVIDFASRLNCGEYFYKKLEMLSENFKSQGVNAFGHRGLWTWFGAVWSDQLLKNSKGNFFVGAHERYVLSTSARRDYRHLLYGPWLVYNAANSRPDLLEIALRDPVTKDSPVFEQLASRKEIVSNLSALTLINSWYRDVKAGAVYPEAIKGDIAGGLRRFGAVYSQLAVNYDLHNMNPDQIQRLLPDEFKPWLEGKPPKSVNRKRRSHTKSRATKRRKSAKKR